MSRLASLVADDSGGHDPRAGGPAPGDFRGTGSAFSVSNLSDLMTTIAIGVGVMILVIVVDKIRRRHRPIRPMDRR
ncbi:MAG TPA: hypothetical protein VGM78_15045 [Ilumatobacteraceae bacterium]